MDKPVHFFPPMPELGHSEKYYKVLAEESARAHAVHAREAAKVGQYVTLGLTEDCSPQEKMKYFRHALRRHCVPPAVSDDVVDAFYERLADFVRGHAGREALRVASVEDDRFAMRLREGESRPKVLFEARQFYDKLMGPQETCPEVFNDEDWEQLKLIRKYWNELADEDSARLMSQTPPPPPSVED